MAKPAPRRSLSAKPNEKINFIGGFDGYTVGNIREIKRLFNLMGVEHTILADNSDVWDTPTDGEFRMYDGGTTLEEAAECRPREGNHFDAGVLHREDTAPHRRAWS